MSAGGSHRDGPDEKLAQCHEQNSPAKNQEWSRAGARASKGEQEKHPGASNDDANACQCAVVWGEL